MSQDPVCLRIRTVANWTYFLYWREWLARGCDEMLARVLANRQ
jgi:hypothetical protein